MGGSNTKRIVILGKTGGGKSSLANTIFGEDVFKIDHSFNSGTSKCRAKTKRVNGRNITFIDTPGLFGTDRSEEELRSEIVRCITECAPGPHAFLIVLKMEKFTEHEKAVINKIQQYFSEEAFKYATVVFTHGEQLPDGQTIESFVLQNKSLSDLVRKCGGRCHIIDNRYWNRNTEDENRSNKFQVEKLLNTLEKMVTENDGSCYTNEMLQAVEEEIQQEGEKIRQTSENVSEEEIREKAKDRVSTKLSVRLAGIGTGVLMGALCGVGVLGVAAYIGLNTIKRVKKIFKVVARGTAAGGAAAAGGGGAAGGTAAGGGAAAGGAAAGGTAGGTVAGGTAAGGTAAGGTVAVVGVCAAVGALVGGVTGYYEAEGAETPQEATKKTFEAVKTGAQTVIKGVNNIFSEKQ